MQDYQFVDGTLLSSVVEAMIFASSEPIPSNQLSELILAADGQVELDPEQIDDIIDKLNRRYEENGLSFEITRVAGGYSFATLPRFKTWLSVLQHEQAYKKLSPSAIEALAIVAYKQPITKPEVDHIRGVDSGYIIRQLLEKELIRVSGRADSPGKPLLYKTSDLFLKHFGINSVKELPKPREIEEILNDDDMAEHRKFLLERQGELLEDQRGEDDEESAHQTLIDIDTSKLDTEALEDESDQDEGAEE